MPSLNWNLKRPFAAVARKIASMPNRAVVNKAVVNKAVVIAAAAAVAASTLGGTVAQAYDEDTHFYATYSMARFSGITHEVAVKLALGAQWMDESYLSDPTSMIVLPITGIRKRRLLHFPSSRAVGEFASVQQQAFGLADKMHNPIVEKIVDEIRNRTGIKVDPANLSFLSNTEPEHPLATALLTQGLKEGNLMKCAASLHTLEDSFAHAGTPAEEGHMKFWHWPDRPFDAVDKYFEMTEAVFSAMVAIRSQLPIQALDCSLTIGINGATNGVPNCKRDAEELQAAYTSLKIVQHVVRYNPLEDRRYIETTMNLIFEESAKLGILKITKPAFFQLVNKAVQSGRKGSYAVLQAVLEAMLEMEAADPTHKVLDLKRLLVATGKVVESPAISEWDYAQAEIKDRDKKAGRSLYSSFAERLANDLLQWQVPLPLSLTHRVELEVDGGPVREKEMELRIGRIRAMINSLYGINLKMIPNNTKDEAGFKKEIDGDPSAEPTIPKSSVVTYATFNLREKKRFNQIIFAYLFPSLNDSDVKTIIDLTKRLDVVDKLVGEYLNKRSEITNSDSFGVVKLAKLALLDRNYLEKARGAIADKASISEFVDALIPVAKPFFKDLYTPQSPAGDEKYYRDPVLLEKLNPKRLLTEENDVWNLISLGLTSRVR